MIDISMFNTRELASVFWIVIIIGVLSFDSPVRSSFIKLIQAFLVKTIILTFLSAAIYICLIVLFLYTYNLWETTLLKTTVFWFLFVASVALFKVNKISENKDYFKKAIIENLKLTVLLEFIIGLYTFNFWFEILLIPLFLFIGALLAVSEKDSKFLLIHSILKRFVLISNLLMISFIFFQIWTHYENYLKEDTLNEFLLPILLSIVFLPFLYFLSLYIAYETAFLALSNNFRDPYLLFYAKRKAILNFNFDTIGLNRWKHTVFLEENKTRLEIADSIKKIKRLQAIEKEPPSVSLDLGWSPYKAKDFLGEFGLETGYYSHSFDDDWGACSKYIELNKEVLSNNIAYYINGDRDIAKTLKLKLNVYSPDLAYDAHAIFLDAAKLLYRKALNKELPKNIETAILIGNEIEHNDSLSEIKISKEEWGNSTKGYDLKFEINHNSLSSISK